MSFSISKEEIQFITQGVAQNKRNDGRTRLDFRHFDLETNILSHTMGSCRLHLGETNVLVSVKAEIGQPIGNGTKGHIICSVDCCPSASPEFEGRGAETLNNQLAQHLERMLMNADAVDLKSLCFIENKLCWILYVDVMVLDSGGNLFDAISMATKAALFTTKIPKLIVDSENNDFELDDTENMISLDVSNCPIAITFQKIGNHFVVDATLEEEACMSLRLTLALNREGKICGIEKGGSGGVDPNSLTQIYQSAITLGTAVVKKLDEALQSLK